MTQTTDRIKKSLVKLIVAFGLIASPDAMPLPAFQPPEIEVFVSGSSAQDELLEDLMRLRVGVEGSPNLCLEGTLDIYRGEIDGTSKRVFYCLTSENVPGVGAGRRLAIHKSSGGSGEGVTPIDAGIPISFIDLQKIETCDPPVRVLQKGELAGYSNHRNCTGPGKTAIPLAGISDIEPELLGSPTQELNKTSLSQLVWGLPVTKNFRNALQAIQGLVSAEVAHDSPFRDLEENMPSLSYTQLASIFAGRISRWEHLVDEQGFPAHLSPKLANQPPINPDMSGTSPGAYRPDPDTGANIYVCRRIASSGTQASYEIHYLRNRCVVNAPQFVVPDDGSNILTGGNVKELLSRSDPAGRVFAGVGTSDVRACLDTHEEYNRWAIGMLSTENIGDNVGREYRHIKVDGAAPTLLNTYQGRWTHISVPSLQWLAKSTPAGEIGILLQFIVDNIGLPRVLKSLNESFVHSWGQGGYLANPSNFVGQLVAPVTAEKLQDLPVASMSKTINGQPQNCNVPLIAAPTTLSQF